MQITEIFKLAIEAIRVNKLRSVLTSLGIIIGVAAIILLVSIGSGLQNYVTSEFKKLGANSIFILPGKVEISAAGTSAQSVNKLTFALMNKLEQAKSPNIEKVLPFIEIFVTASNKNSSKVTRLVASYSDYFAISGIKTSEGRIYTDSEEKSSKKVAVIGKTIAKDLYKNQSPIGKQISLSKKPFTVIGVFEPQGSVAGVDVDNAVIIPLSAGRNLTGTDLVNQVLVRTTSTENIQEAKKDIEKILLRTLSEDDFTIMTQEQLLSSILQILGVLTLALGGIAAISLVVGGVGISNIMLVSVTERTREIGLRKAVGARPSDILIQFLLEAVILSLVGGAIGLLIGATGSFLISAYIKSSVPLWAIFLGVGFSSLVGIIFGVAPAIRASRLDPIVALRYE